ncbi:hypothetical protein GCM10010123_16170 [Pilimelia anulata]|uniref:UBP-type domain-containing protein n=1 Tax=Pilimelia anulata TaxID=53371 RepID=A0A8J3B8Z4_9ACTN|nr:UBP-type zinc finger domain-containing protein [Pilimelia anulata]GGJ87355.1 hypothetical protein GCM10010123_16170 [Pilimelia anulata]
MSCEHLRSWPVPADAGAGAVGAGGCPDCVAVGATGWVHLRQCLACGHVGCCDSSPYQHARAHWNASGHPVMRSIEPGESWRWCWSDDRLG